MKAVILAAGIGSRLRPLTSDKPKCLVKVAGKALLDYQIDSYKLAGISDICIVIGYEGEKIKNHCRKYKDINITFVENIDYEQTNNMYSLYLAREFVDGESFFLNNADLIISENVVPIMINDPFENLVAVDTSVYNEESMKISVKNGLICDISKSIPDSQSYGCSIDFYKISANSSKILFKNVINIIEVQKNLKDWTEIALQKLFNNNLIECRPVHIDKEKWVEIDNYDDLALADKLFSDFDFTLNGITTFFIDLDGTVYLGENAINGSVETINKWKDQGKKIYFISNNSSKSKKEYVQKLKKIGYDCTEDNIILSTDGIISFLKENNVSDIFVLGTKSLSDYLEASGFTINENNPEYVVVGYDTELSYQKLVIACKLIHKGVEYVATHCDIVCPTPDGPIPDAGALLQLLELTTGKRPLLISGKPNLEMINHIFQKDKTESYQTVVIGDRLYTDMMLARNANAKSILVLSGESTREDYEHIDFDISLCVPTISEIG
jgi:HAD superfamily hydrolase (TIGR01450 family)